jgi:hypothetical protein
MLAFGSRDEEDVSIYECIDVLKMAVFWVVEPCCLVDLWKTSTTLDVLYVLPD